MSRGRIVFVTTELYPETEGGAGVVVDALSRGLARDTSCLVVLASSEPIEVTRRDGVEVVVAAIPPQDFLERAKAVAGFMGAAVRPGDRIEVQDFEGLGFWMLVHRAKLGLEQIPITIRFHGPYDLLAQAMETEPEDWAIPRIMENWAFRMSDGILIPAQGHEAVLMERYDVPEERIHLSPPPIPSIQGTVPLSESRSVFASIGRLGEMKGSQDLVRAAVSLLEEGLDLKVRFIGGDGWSPTSSRPMSEWLRSLVPMHLRDAFEFVGPIARDELPHALTEVLAVVVPSRFESFCLAAHEGRRLGLPVIVADLPAFSGLFTEAAGALVYDGSTDGLAASMRRLIKEPALAKSLSSRPAPEPGVPWPAYLSDPEPRHPRSQAGLATAAMKALEEATRRPSRQGGAALRRLYRHLPAPVAHLASRLVPMSLKERARGIASWPEEQARAQRETRLRDVQNRIDAGDFPELEEPDVTVVIPVHDQVQFLEETLASVYEQTHPSWEIIVVDDGSTDPETVRFLDSLDRPRLRLIRQSNMGLPGARNTGMRLARGDHLVPLDSDDELEPEFMTKLLVALESAPNAGYAHCLARLHGDIDAVWVPRPFNPYWQLMGNGIIGCVLLRAIAWEAVGGYDETMTAGNEDWDLWLRLMEAGWDQVSVPEPLFKYRKHGVSMSVTTEARFEEGRRMLRDRHPDLYEIGRFGDLKQQWYPLLTIVGVADSIPNEAELVTTPDGLTDTWGKYVVDIRGSRGLEPDTLPRLADLLERNPDIAVARTNGDPPLTMLRRWNLHDPEATPAGELVLDHLATGPPAPQSGLLHRDGWTTPHAARMPGVPVQRQRPEEAGTMPNPEEW